MVPRATFESTGVLGAFVSTVQAPQEATGAGGNREEPSVSLAALVVLTSLAFLVPARVSFSIGRIWLAGVFASMASVCVLYHICDTDLPLGLGLGTACPGESKHALTLLDHGWAYYSLLQMAFLVLGPDDPAMQWIDHPAALRVPGSSLIRPPPWYVVVVARLLPAFALAAFATLNSSWRDFHWRCLILCDALLLFGCSAFWLHPDRRASAPMVLIRLHFWRQAWNHFVCPVLLTSFAFVAMESLGSQALHALWHLLLAALGTGILRAFSSQDLNAEKAAMGPSLQNPAVVRLVLGSVSAFGLTTLGLSLISDWWVAGHWRWPLVSMSMLTAQHPGGYVLVLGALPTLVALTASFWLIRSTATMRGELEGIVIGKRLGCSVGYWSVAFGLLALAASGCGSPAVHLLCLIISLCLLLVAMLLTSLSTRHSLDANNCGQYLIQGLSVVSVMWFLMLLLVTQQSAPNGWKVPQPLLALSEYAALAMPTLWPLSWAPEVEARWQTRQGRWAHSSRKATPA